MQAEAEGDFDSATAIYKHLREDHPANPVRPSPLCVFRRLTD